VFGWISFRSLPSDQSVYVTYLFGFPAGAFPLHTVTAFLLFHGLDIAAILVLAGVFLSLWRRLRDRGAQTLQSFAMDFSPVILLFAISVTGLALTVSQEWLRGAAYSFLAITHAVTVIAGLLYLPFREILPYLSTSGATRRETLPESRGKRPGRDLPAVPPAVCIGDAHPGSEDPTAETWIQLCVAADRLSLAGLVSAV
jgi:hypothetical protein